MTGVTQAVFMNQRSFVEPPPTVIGQAFGGGFYAGQISTTGNGVANYYLVIAPKSTESSLQWKTSQTYTAGTDSTIDGPSNSANMNNATHPAAQYCEALTIGGYTNWYLPAKNELEVCYYNLKPTTTSNNTSSGQNSNAVPSRGSNYSSGTPAQTSAAAFQSGGAQAFDSSYYWCSTQSAFSNAVAWGQVFSTGYQSYKVRKTYTLVTRATRRVAV